MKSQNKGPQFIRFFKPVIECLKELDGSGTTAEVIDRAIEKLNISEKEQQTTTKNGQSRVRNQVNWARLYLVHAGYLDSSIRGVWSLTERGIALDIREFEPYTTFKAVQALFKDEKIAVIQPGSSTEETDDLPDDEQTYRTTLLDLIKSLPPAGFERLSQRLLRESGFQQVVVTGKSGDGGIDGIGILKVNPFVSFNVLFQCKRYQGSVTPSHVRDFRGAMQGRADKGLIITTGTFTVDATKEARRDGVPPIELVDGQLLVEMFERLELGLIPRRTFDIDEKFFDDFKI